jgi:hypothetical protein
VKSLGAEGRPQPVDVDDDKTKLGQRGIFAEFEEEIGVGAE